MSEKKRRFHWMHGMALGVTLLVALGITLVVIVSRGVVDRWARAKVIEQMEAITGARVNLGSFHLQWRPLRAHLSDLTLHGSEPAGTPPLFHADEILIGIHVESIWERRISLSNFEISHFSGHIRVEPDGSTNFPGPKAASTAASQSTSSGVQHLFDLIVAHVRLADGEILWNDRRVPLAAEGGTLQFAMNLATDAGRPAYLGQISWQKFNFAAGNLFPFASDVSAKFILRPDSLSFPQVQWKAQHSQVDLTADLASFYQPSWTFRYRGATNFEDIRALLQQPDVPQGHMDFTGDAKVDARHTSFDGYYVAGGIGMNDPYFHTTGMTSSGNYHANQNALDVPDLEGHLLSGDVTGNLHLDFHTQAGSFNSRVRGIDLTQLLAALDNQNLPVIPLHWAARVNVDASTTWAADFRHLDVKGFSDWMPIELASSKQIPATAHLEFDYKVDQNRVDIPAADITTPTSHVMGQGYLGNDDSSLTLNVDAEDVSQWDDFIHRIQNADSNAPLIAGHAHWRGRLTGPLGGPTFTGHLTGTEARYDTLYWDTIDGELLYSPDVLRLTRWRASRGRSSADLELTLNQHMWSFDPDSTWTMDVSLVEANPDDLQSLFGLSYPVHGVLSGEFHAKGTREHPEVSGLADLSALTAWNYHIDRARGQVAWQQGLFSVSNAEVRLPPHTPGAPQGLLTGNVTYRTGTKSVTFDVTGAALALEAIQSIQTPSLPVGGRLNLQVHGEGPVSAPELEGTMRLVDLKLGNEVAGSFQGNITSDGHQLTATVESAMPTGHLDGKLQVSLEGEYPLSGEMTAEQVDFDSIIVSAMHLTRLTGHSTVDGHFAFAGFAARPETIAVECNISRIGLEYANVKLQNSGPVRLTYGRDQVRIEQASLKGSDSDFSVSGFARFANDRAIQMRVDGALSLQLLAGFVPRLVAGGRAQVNASIAGTLSDPRFNGKVHLEGSSIRYGDFPAGLSNLAGDFNFDTKRLTFDNVKADSGGGHLTVRGNVVYGDQPLNYTVNITSDQTRIRYPVGMSWLVGGGLTLSGNAQASTLSGRIVVDRLFMADGFDITSLMGSSKEAVNGPNTNSPFLRNLQFDIQADSSPDSRMQWTGANFQTEANLRVRGTWEHPILLGHIQLLTGEMTFRGNRYTISRGDIDFASPFRIDPVLNVEAVTTIRQYEVTLDFTGPGSQLNLSYRSDPPLPSSDIVALLALGQTSEESTQRTASGQPSSLGATTLLSEALSSQLGGRVQRLFGISQFRVGPAISGLTANQNSLASVTIEQQVTPGLVITYTTDVNSTQYQIIQIEYTVNREFSVVALRDENGTFGIDVVRKTRFK